MRTIKFRAWDEKEKVMIPEVRVVGVPDAPYIPMQFTGLLDKNGKEIYEGDIMEWTVRMFNSEFQTTEVITDLRTAFEFEGSEETETWKVIGNIYENPDLLTSKHV